MAGSTSAEAATDVGGRIRREGEKRERRVCREERGDRGGEAGLENKVEGCLEPAVPLIIGIIP